MIILLAAGAAAAGIAAGRLLAPAVRGLFKDDARQARVLQAPTLMQQYEPREPVDEPQDDYENESQEEAYDEPQLPYESEDEAPDYQDAERSAGGCMRRAPSSHSAGGMAAANAVNDAGRQSSLQTTYWDYAAAGDNLLGSLEMSLDGFRDEAAMFAGAYPEEVPVEELPMERVSPSDLVFAEATEIDEEPDIGAHEMRHAGGNAEDLAIVKRGILPAFLEGSHDPPVWTQLSVGDYELMVTAEPLAVGGIRLPTTWKDQIEIARRLGALPITPAISNARWAAGKQVLAQPIPNTGKPEDTITYNAMIGPNTGVLTDGYFKESVLHPKLAATGNGAMAQYGFRKPGGGTHQQGFPGIHNEYHADYSNTPTYVSNQALFRGEKVNLIDEMQRGCALGGPIPSWLADRLRGGVA